VNEQTASSAVNCKSLQVVIARKIALIKMCLFSEWRKCYREGDISLENVRFRKRFLRFQQLSRASRMESLNKTVM